MSKISDSTSLRLRDTLRDGPGSVGASSSGPRLLALSSVSLPSSPECVECDVSECW